MLSKIVIKNPGCTYCRYNSPAFSYRNKSISEACTKDARRLFNQNGAWKWVDCSFPTERNKDRTCRYFKVPSTLITLFEKILFHNKGAKEQTPPAYKRDIWWNG